MSVSLHDELMMNTWSATFAASLETFVVDSTLRDEA